MLDLFSATNNSFYVTFATEDNNDKVIFEVLFIHTRCTVQKQFKVDQLVYIVPEKKLKAQNCKERLDINEEISLQRRLHDRKRTLKQSELQIT